MNILLHRLYAHHFKQLTDVTLHFPPQGTVLIEGANEAGKSSLFEAVFFGLYGQGIAGGRLEDLRCYETEEMRVELDFSIDGRLFSITRTFRGNHRAALTFPNADGVMQTMGGVTAIKDRIREELHLSPEALLNTCFVEQKKLERLEDLKPEPRKTAINELLNLRVLTQMETEFKVTREDEERLRLLRERVKIARLDADLPELQTSEREASRCLRYMQALDCAALVQQLQEEIERAHSAQERIRLRRAEIGQALEECGRLRALILAVDTDLMHRAQAWRSAVTEQEKAQVRVRELERLCETLPGREEQLHRWETLAERLSDLEALEREVEALQADRNRTQQEIAGYDATLQLWQAGEDHSDELEKGRERQQTACEEAEACLQARHTANQRVEQLARLLQHGTASETAAQEAARLQEQARIAREDAAYLPIVRARLENLERAKTRTAQLAADRRELTRTEEAISELDRKQAEHAERLARIGAMESELELAETQAAAQEETEREAATILRNGETRAALTAWAEAAERVSEADPAAGKMTELEARRKESQTRLEETARQFQAAARQAAPGFAVTGVGIAAGVGGLAAGMAATLGVLGVILTVIGLTFGVRALRNKQAAQTAQAEAKSRFDALEGERRAVEGQMQTHAARLQEWKAREAECRRVLENGRIPVPATPAEARGRLSNLPEIVVSEAQAAHRAALNELNRHRNDCEVRRRTLDNERRDAAQVDTGDLAARLAERSAERERLRAALAGAEDLPQILAALGVEADAGALETALQETQNETARCTAQANAVGDLEHRQESKAEEARAQAEQARSLAEELALPGATLAEQCALAGVEREGIRAEKTAVPDNILHEETRQAQESLTTLQQEIAAHAAGQNRRRQELDAKPRETRIAEQEEIAQTLVETAARLEPLGDVRPALQADDLPVEAGPLRLRLAAVKTDLEHDRTEAAKLPEAHQDRQTRAETASACRDELAEAWTARLAEPPPAAPQEALERLPQIRAETQQTLSQRNEPGLREEDRALETEYAERAEETAIARNRQAQESKRQTQLLTELEVAADTPLETLPERYPELAQARERTAEEWETQTQTRRDAVRNNRTTRRANAQSLGIGDDLLDAEAETNALIQADQAVNVKRRAGEIVARTRQSIVGRIMPLTMQNMRQLLPLLTEGRYQDVEWNEEENALSVYDSRARGYQRKSIFSGGAKDQISLALRLAFALATLPGEHNVRPGWLFLDEPLSSFDRTRTLSLVDLLTRGLIRREFAQILLISHSESFDPARFDYRVRMDGGRVVENTLPPEMPAQAVVAVREVVEANR